MPCWVPNRKSCHKLWRLRYIFWWHHHKQLTFKDKPKHPVRYYRRFFVHAKYQAGPSQGLREGTHAYQTRHWCVDSWRQFVKPSVARVNTMPLSDVIALPVTAACTSFEVHSPANRWLVSIAPFSPACPHK